MPLLRIASCGLALLCTGVTAFGRVSIVRDGKVCAVIVTAVKPSPVAAYAVKELATHVEKATGQRLPVAVETAIPQGYPTRIFVGAAEAALAQGIDPNTLEIEEYVLRTVGDDLCILGKEMFREQYKGTRPHGEPWNPLSGECMHSGALFGVYEVLERYLGVRWLSRYLQVDPSKEHAVEVGSTRRQPG